jgi:hypothetical protein
MNAQNCGSCINVPSSQTCRSGTDKRLNASVLDIYTLRGTDFETSRYQFSQKVVRDSQYVKKQKIGKI